VDRVFWWKEVEKSCLQNCSWPEVLATMLQYEAVECESISDEQRDMFVKLSPGFAKNFLGC